MLNPLLASLLSWKSEDFLSDPREGREVESVAVSNRDCVGVQSTAHVHVLKIRLSLEKPTPTSRSVSLLFLGAELKKMGIFYA